MRYKKFRADRLFDGYRFREQGSVLICEENGKVEAIVPASEAGDAIQPVEGILTPGLINCHCHLELSHLKDIIPPHTGLIDFLCSVVTKREDPANGGKVPAQGGIDPAIRKNNAIIAAEKEMYDNGIVAVGDIGNTADTAAVKAASRIRWQNFVEVLSFTDEKAEENFTQYAAVAQTLENALRGAPSPHRTSLVPHAPYSISPRTFQLINEATPQAIISIHNQEHPAEDELYRTGGGEYLRFFRIFGFTASPFPVTGLSSIRSVLPHFTKGQTIFLIHNTYMPEEDITWANEFAAAKGLQLIYCLCINANLYIENKVPPVELFIRQGCRVVLGTDSYSSNWQLSIAKELESLHTHFPSIPLETILQWATSSGARALQWDDELGSFEKGKTPGVVQLKEDLSGSSRLA